MKSYLLSLDYISKFLKDLVIIIIFILAWMYYCSYHVLRHWIYFFFLILPIDDAFHCVLNSTLWLFHLFFNIIVYCFLGDFTLCIPSLLISQSFHILPLSWNMLTQLIKNKTNNNNKKPSSFLHFSNTFSFTLVALGALVGHTVYFFVLSAPPMKRSL